MWIIGSALFSLYVANFANYNKTYGSMGAIVILLTSIFVIPGLVLVGGVSTWLTRRRQG